MNYYNDIDKGACAWLREMIADGLIPEGDVDDRDIRDVWPRDLRGFTQCHFFAGVGGWVYALRLAGVPDDIPLWTGSCPCQPFSVAGKRAGVRDKRHVFPVWARLIAECGPTIVLGEQVASADGRKWFSGVRSSLEYMGYSVGAADLCAAGIGAPHIRQRLLWVADDNGSGRGEQRGAESVRQEQSSVEHAGYVDYTRTVWWPCRDGKRRRVPARRMGDESGLRRREEQSLTGRRGSASGGGSLQTAGHDRVEVEPSLFPLADGVPGRVGILRGAGNAIHPQVAAEFIRATL